jgi:hypothetical protein
MGAPTSLCGHTPTRLLLGPAIDPAQYVHAAGTGSDRRQDETHQPIRKTPQDCLNPSKAVQHTTISDSTMDMHSHSVSHLAQVGQPDDALGVRLQVAQLHTEDAVGRLHGNTRSSGPECSRYKGAAQRLASVGVVLHVCSPTCMHYSCQTDAMRQLTTTDSSLMRLLMAASKTAEPALRGRQCGPAALHARIPAPPPLFALSA